MINAEVKKQFDGVKVTFSGGVEKQSVVSMVQRCQSGRCDCMSESAKKKIEALEVSGDDGDVELAISGDLDVEEIRSAVSRSPLLKDGV